VALVSGGVAVGNAAVTGSAMVSVGVRRYHDGHTEPEAQIAIGCAASLGPSLGFLTRSLGLPPSALTAQLSSRVALAPGGDGSTHLVVDTTLIGPEGATVQHLEYTVHADDPSDAVHDLAAAAGGDDAAFDRLQHALVLDDGHLTEQHFARQATDVVHVATPVVSVDLQRVVLTPTTG
jgi:hypothetical protein